MVYNVLYGAIDYKIRKNLADTAAMIIDRCYSYTDKSIVILFYII